MATAKAWTQDDFSGGQNDLLPANQISNSEVVSLVNLFPGEAGEPLRLRGGISPVLSELGEPYTSLYNYRRTVDMGLGTSMYLAATQTAVYRITGLGGSTPVTTLAFTWETAGQDTQFVTFMNNVFAMNGVDEMRVWDGSPTGTWDKVRDRDGISNEDGQPLPSPILRFAVPFRGRLWGIGSDGNVWFCGTDDASDEIFPNTTPATYYKRWQVWSGSLDSDGGSVNVGDDSGQRTVGHGFMFNGIVIFKERMTYIWSYSEDLHPADTGGASIDILVPAVGLAAQETIAYQDGSLIFLGQDASFDYGIYRLSGDGIDDIAVRVPQAMRRVIANSSSRPRAIIYEDYYVLAADDYDSSGTARTLVCAYDLRRKCWIEIRGWNVGAFCYSTELDRLLIADGQLKTIHKYPHAYVDGVDTPISYQIVTKEIDGGNPVEDHRWRKGFVDVVGVKGEVVYGLSLDGGEPIEYTNTYNISGLDYWEDVSGPDGSSWDDGSAWFIGSAEHRIAVDIAHRSRTAQLTITGSSSVEMSIRRLSLLFKQKKLTYHA